LSAYYYLALHCLPFRTVLIRRSSGRSLEICQTLRLSFFETNTVEPGYNVIAVCDTSSVPSYIYSVVSIH